MLINAPILRLAARFNRGIGIAPRFQGTAANGRRGRTRTADRHRRRWTRSGTARSRCAAASIALRPTASCSPMARSEKFDAIILATGFRPDLRQYCPMWKMIFDRSTVECRYVDGRRATKPRPGYISAAQITSPTGQLREIGLEAHVHCSSRPRAEATVASCSPDILQRDDLDAGVDPLIGRRVSMRRAPSCVRDWPMRARAHRRSKRAHRHAGDRDGRTLCLASGVQPVQCTMPALHFPGVGRWW